jgi:type I restriction enzyme R subunit
VIADEAHRSQYDLIEGLSRNLRDSLPRASFIGFTGASIEKTDANTRAVFGDLADRNSARHLRMRLCRDARN